MNTSINKVQNEWIKRKQRGQIYLINQSSEQKKIESNLKSAISYFCFELDFFRR